MRVLLVKGESAYDASRLFVDDLARAFARRGDEAVVIDGLAVPNLAQALAMAPASGAFDLVYTINILGDYRDGAGRSLGQIIGAPHVLQLVDHPLTHFARLDNADRAMALLLLDRSHVEAVRAVYGADHFAHVGFSPAGAVGEITPIPGDADASVAARPTPILFPGTYHAPAAEPWAAFPDGVRPILADAVERMMADEFISALSALDGAMRQVGLDPDDANFAGFRKVATYVNEYVRAYRREQFLSAAAAFGLPLHVFGGGYGPHLARLGNITWHGEAGLAQILDEMRRARVVLNINANFRDGAHDRPFTAAAAGAACASDASLYLAETFKPGVEIELFSWLDLEAGLARIADLANDAERVHAMAIAAQKRVAEQHLWDHRIDNLIAAASATRASLLP